MIPAVRAFATATNVRVSDAADWVFAAGRPFRLLKLVVINWAVCSGLYSLVEHRGPIEGGWWGLVTGSTVGYGDQYPASTLGKGIAAWLIVSSIVGIALLTGQVSGWCNRDAWTHAEQEEMKRRVKNAERDAAAARKAAELAVTEMQALRAEIRQLLDQGAVR